MTSTWFDSEAVWKAVQRSVDTIVPNIKAMAGLKGRGSSWVQLGDFHNNPLWSKPAGCLLAIWTAMGAYIICKKKKSPLVSDTLSLIHGTDMSIVLGVDVCLKSKCFKNLYDGFCVANRRAVCFSSAGFVYL